MTKQPQWRLIPFLAAPGTVQMAIDAWLLRDYLPQTERSTLRFYDWSTPTISLGCFQKSWPDDWQRLSWQAAPLELVKRPTGGRAVLHQGSLTYSLVMRKEQRKRQELYPCVCQFLIQAWQRWGVELTFGGAGRGYIHNPSCFNTATAADLVTMAGDKLIGSAQRQTPTGLLQHGSMIWDTDRRLFEQIFQQPAPWQQTLAELTGHLPLSQILQTLEASAAAHFQCDLIPEPLTESEWTAIAAYGEEFQVS
jgi:lipoate-protein ligase A